MSRDNWESVKGRKGFKIYENVYAIKWPKWAVREKVKPEPVKVMTDAEHNKHLEQLMNAPYRGVEFDSLAFLRAFGNKALVEVLDATDAKENEDTYSLKNIFATSHRLERESV